MTDIPAGAKKPTDRAKKEVKAEVEGGGAVMWRGKKVTVKPRGDWSWDAGDMLNEGQFRGWAEGALTPDSLAHVAAKKPTLTEFGELMGELLDALGEDLGESKGSSGS